MTNNIIKQRKFYRLYEIIGDQKKGIEPIIPVSRSHWLKGVKAEVFPSPVKLGERMVVWRASDIEKLVNKISSGDLSG